MMGTLRVRSRSLMRVAVSKPSMFGICASIRMTAKSSIKESLESRVAAVDRDRFHRQPLQDRGERDQVVAPVVDEQHLRQPALSRIGRCCAERRAPAWVRHAAPPLAVAPPGSSSTPASGPLTPTQRAIVSSSSSRSTGLVSSRSRPRRARIRDRRASLSRSGTRLAGWRTSGFAGSCGSFRCRPARHHRVHQHDVDVLCLAEQPHPVGAVVRVEHLHAMDLQDAGQRENVPDIIVDDQHCRRRRGRRRYVADRAPSCAGSTYAVVRLP